MTLAAILRAIGRAPFALAAGGGAITRSGPPARSGSIASLSGCLRAYRIGIAVFGAPFTVWARDPLQDAKTRAPRGAHPSGTIALVGAGPGARDLLTLRAIERLREADVVFYDRLVEDDVLELARRDAELVFVGKHVGANAWPQERINAVIIAEARKGRRVIRLKSGDPGIFGRAGEELQAAREAGIPVEIVPGVTAASAAGAALGQSLTERGVADTLILSTGMSRSGSALPDATRFSGPGTTTALYMSVAQAPRIRAALLARGMPADAQVSIAVDVSKPRQRLLGGTLQNLEQFLRENAVSGCAIILATWPAGTHADAQQKTQPTRLALER